MNIAFLTVILKNLPHAPYLHISLKIDPSICKRFVCDQSI